MNIVFDPDRQLFHLQNERISYVMQLQKGGFLTHLYWGKRIREYHVSNPILFYNRGFSPNVEPTARSFSPDTIPLEYPGYGAGDYRSPAVQVQLADGSSVVDLRYQSHQIRNGKPVLEGLPAVYTRSDEEAMTLEIILADMASGLRAALSYTIFRDYDALCRSVKLVNEGQAPMKVQEAASVSVDFRDSGYDMLTLYGGHNNERHLNRQPLSHGIQSIASNRGASSHQYNPFLVLARRDAGEETGDVYGFSLVYSGSFSARAEVDQTSLARVTMGINPFDFSWLLEPGGSFQTPEAVLVYSSQGLGGMSRTFHHLYRERLCRGKFQKAERPVLINNWEATYFQFDADKIYEIAKKGRELGIELLVLDDGWFGKRDDDNSSLGDWFVNKKKFPNGLDSLIRKVTALGMRFGLWFEPEMVSEDSELYRAHPDWCLHVPNRPHVYCRNQLVLDLSRQDVQDYIVDAVSAILSSSEITYVKWDMNRHMTGIGSALLPPERQRETAHRYMLGLYKVLERVTSRFPDVLFESCSGGGGRFDPGILYYMPQTWTSDNTDAVCRLGIQYSTSLVYPPVSMGSHVSVSPNHQVGRITPMKTRGLCAMSGNLGYELDITKLSQEDQEAVKEQIAFYKAHRSTLQYGDFYRILSPYEGSETAWCFVSPDRSEAVMMYFKVLCDPGSPVTILRCRGLDPDAAYREEETGKVYGGDELMQAGLSVPLEWKDFVSRVWVFHKVS